MAADETPEQGRPSGCGTELTLLIGRELRLAGLVQGVGMRPAIFRLAKRFGLRGGVCNEGGRVRLRLWGESQSLEAFRRELLERPPPRARIDEMAEIPLAGPAPQDFCIETSRPAAATEVPLDVAVCEDCVTEIFDPNNRRYRYPFTHCAQCGPRFTILEQLPYDRVTTSLKSFPLCP